MQIWSPFDSSNSGTMKVSFFCSVEHDQISSHGVRSLLLALAKLLLQYSFLHLKLDILIF